MKNPKESDDQEHIITQSLEMVRVKYLAEHMATYMREAVHFLGRVYRRGHLLLLHREARHLIAHHTENKQIALVN
jgi:hypothetical protein